MCIYKEPVKIQKLKIQLWFNHLSKWSGFLEGIEDNLHGYSRSFKSLLMHWPQLCTYQLRSGSITVTQAQCSGQCGSCSVLCMSYKSCVLERFVSWDMMPCSHGCDYCHCWADEVHNALLWACLKTCVLYSLRDDGTLRYLKIKPPESSETDLGACL